MLVEMFDSLQLHQIDSNPTSVNKLLFKEEKINSKSQRIVAKYFFLSDLLMDWLGGKGCGMMATCAHDCIPAKIKPFIHHTKVGTTHQ